MRSRFCRVLPVVCVLGQLTIAAPNQSTGPMYERLICVVPSTGSGTLADPRRPLFAPAEGQRDTLTSARKTKGFSTPLEIIGYRSVPTDDGLNYIVEFVARDRAAFNPILASPQVTKIFDLRKQPSRDVLPELRKLKRNFDLTSFLGGAL